MLKPKLARLQKNFLSIKPWYFLGLFVISAVICVVALRNNNQTIAKLRSQLYTADKNNSNVSLALSKLQAYVTTHMNTNLSAGPNAPYPPIQLVYTYNRLVAAQNDQITNQIQQANGQLYTDAQTYCQKVDSTDFSGHNRVPCIEQYVQSHGTKLNLNIEPISSSLYKFNFLSPTWSPDLAGWSLLASIVLLLLFIVSWVADRWFRHLAR